MQRNFDRRATYPGERMIVLAEQRREWRAGLSALVAVMGASIGSWLMLSSPQDAAGLADSVVPAADAAALFTDRPIQPDRLTRAGPILEAQAATVPKPAQQPMEAGKPDQASIPLAHGDIVEVQQKLKALGYDPGPADGYPGKRTLQALNDYRRSLGLKPTDTVDRQAVAPLTP